MSERVKLDFHTIRHGKPVAGTFTYNPERVNNYTIGALKRKSKKEPLERVVAFLRQVEVGDLTVNGIWKRDIEDMPHYCPLLLLENILAYQEGITPAVELLPQG